jgi:CubicO group peptidase (beta-lactamase class C family)
MRNLILILLLAFHAYGRPAPSQIAARVDEFAQQAMSKGVGSALGVAIVMDGEIVYERAFGMADATARIAATKNSLWYIASTSKSFTGMAVAILASQGKIDIHAPINTVLPNAKWHPDVKPETLTLADFLTHTMGLSPGAVVENAAFTGNMPESRWPELLQYSTPLPTRDMIYNNLGYNVAAMVIDRQRSEGWRKYLEAMVFAPVGMRETYHRVSGLDPRRIAKPHDIEKDLSFKTRPFVKNDRTMNSAGGHLATLHDLARWTIVNMQDGKIDGRQVLPAAAVRMAHQQLAPHTREPSRTFGPFKRSGWAIGWDIGTYEGEPMVSRFGSYDATRSHLSYLPARNIGVVAMTTSPLASRFTDIIAAYAYDLEAERPDALARAEAGLASITDRLKTLPEQLAATEATRAARQKPLAHPLSSYTGTFEHPGYGTMTWTVHDGRLHYRYGAFSGPVEIYDADKNQFRADYGGGGSVATFVLDAGGKVREVVFEDVKFTRR